MQRYFNKHAKLSLPLALMVALFALSLTRAEAQTPNMLPYGDFATPDPADPSRPMGWSASQGQLVYLPNASDPRPGSKDNHLISFSGGFWLKSMNGSSPIRFAVDGSTDYTCLFWHKGTTGGAKLQVIMRMYDSDGVQIRMGNKVLSSGETEAGQWRQAKLQVKWGSVSYSEDALKLEPGTAMISFELRNSNRGDSQIYLDDVAFVPKGREGELDNADAPQPIQVPLARLSSPRGFQREIDLSWEQDYPEGDDRDGSFSWELTVGEGEPVLLITPKYTLTRLEPNRSYQIRLRTLYKDGRSGPLVRELQTAPLQFSAEDPLRVPYLRLITRDGYAPEVLPLYFSELVRGDALFRYWIDGQEVTPEGDALHFPSKGAHSLRVYVREDDDHVWTLDYNQLIVR